MSRGPSNAARPSTFRRLMRFAAPYKGRLMLGGLFGVVFAGSTLGALAGLSRFADLVFGAGAAQGDGTLSLKTRLWVASLLPLFGILRGVGDYLSTYLMEWVGQRVIMDLRTRTFDRMQEVSLAFYHRMKSSELISRMVNDSMMVERAVSTVLADLVKQPATFIALTIGLFWNNAELAITGLVLFPICIVPVALFGKRVRRFAREGQEKLADVVSIIQETALGAHIVRAFGMEAYERGRFLAQCRAVFSRAMRVTRARASVEPIIVAMSTFGLALFLLYTMWRRVTFGEFLMFAGSLVALYDPVKKLSKIHMQIQQSAAAGDRLFELLDAPIDVKEAADARAFDEPLREVAFEHVAFAYTGEPVLRDIDFTLPAGCRAALVGGSGAGKTTLMNLLPRFYDVTSGRIRLNDADVRGLTLPSLRKQIGIVTQETILFNDTVANNIAYGHSEASREAVVEAARRAHADAFIRALPEAYDTPIGERGLRLSGGQRQRLAIARAILRNPPILLLDEATSALDTESERLVQEALEELMQGRTVLAIAHRLSTIMHADMILVLDRGAIVERGTHTELMARGGYYRRLFDMQFADARGGS